MGGLGRLAPCPLVALPELVVSFPGLCWVNCLFARLCFWASSVQTSEETGQETAVMPSGASLAEAFSNFIVPKREA